MYKVKLISINEFKESKDAWNKLALSMNFPSIFCTWEWIYTWWEHFGRDYEPVILFVYKDAGLVGILPLAYHKTKNGILNSRKLIYCGSNELYPDHLDIICAKEDADDCLNAIFEFFSSEYKDWDVLNISLFSEDSSLLHFLNRNILYFASEIRQASVAPYIVLSGSFEEYISRFDKKQRYNLRSRRKKLYEQYGFKYVSSEPLQEQEGLKTLFALHEKRAKRKNIVSSFSGKNIINFHNTLVQRINKNGWLSLRFLRNKNELIAVSYNFIFGGTVFSYQKGLDPAWEHYGPGTVILCELINEAFSNGNIEYNLLHGGEEYKNQWTKSQRQLFTVNIYNKTLRANLAETVSKSKDLLKGNLKKLIGSKH